MRRLLLVAILASILFGRFSAAQDRFPGAAWDHVPLAQSGWSEAALADVQDWSKQIHSTAFMVVHRGAVVAEWGDTAKRTELASVRKSLLSALIGIAVAERKISLDSTLGSSASTTMRPRSPTSRSRRRCGCCWRRARASIIRHSMRRRAMAKARPARGSHAPGTFWYYNNWDFNTLGTIYEQATGSGIYEALDRLIARPIGMQDYRPQDGVYVPGAASIHRAYPLRMSARDLARFGLLYLNKGAWAGTQIVAADWVREEHAGLFGATQLRLRLRLSVVDRAADIGARRDSGGDLHGLGRRRAASVRRSRLRSGGGEPGRSRPAAAGTETVRGQAAAQPDAEGGTVRSLSGSMPAPFPGCLCGTQVLFDGRGLDSPEQCCGLSLPVPFQGSHHGPAGRPSSIAERRRAASSVWATRVSATSNGGA